jgi:hypothetical protein
LRNSASSLAFVLLCAAWWTPAAAAQDPADRAVVRDPARDLACAPQAVVLPPAPSLRIVAGQESGRTLFGTGDAVVVSGGAAQGVRVGQEYFIRRVVKDQFALPLSGFVPISVRTAGWLRVVDVEGDLAIATIADACDGVLPDDYLEPFVRPVEPAAAAAGEPDYRAAGVIILGDERRQIGAAGALMVLDRGSAHGVRPGQRLTLFRDTLGGSGPVLRVGQATAVIVRTDTSVVRIESSRDAVYVGDRAAPHR